MDVTVASLERVMVLVTLSVKVQVVVVAAPVPAGVVAAAAGVPSAKARAGRTAKMMVDRRILNGFVFCEVVSVCVLDIFVCCICKIVQKHTGSFQVVLLFW